MKSLALTTTAIVVLGVSLVVLATTGSVPARLSGGQPSSDPCAARLATFDTLDFDVFSNQKWNRLSESHASDIVVTWPDGHETSGITRHIDDLKGMFVRSEEHTSELQSPCNLVCRLLLEKKKTEIQ